MGGRVLQSSGPGPPKPKGTHEMGTTQDPLAKLETRVAEMTAEVAKLRQRKAELGEQLGEAFLAVEYRGEADKAGTLAKLRSDMAALDEAIESKNGALAQMDDLRKKVTRDARQAQLERRVADQAIYRREAGALVRQIADRLAGMSQLVRDLNALGEESHTAYQEILGLEREGDLPEMPRAHLQVLRNLGNLLGVSDDVYEMRLLDLADAAGELEHPEGTNPRSVRLQNDLSDWERRDSLNKARGNALLADDRRTQRLASLGVSNIATNVDERAAERIQQAEARTPSERVILGDRIVTVQRPQKSDL